MTDELTPAAPALQDSPWKADIEAISQDPVVQAAFDTYMRAKVQPRMTQYEQQIAAAQDARELYEAFQQDPVGTYYGVRAQLEEAGYELEEVAEQPIVPDTPAPEAPAPDPRLEEIYADYQARQQREAEAADQAEYNSLVDQVLADPDNAGINKQHFHQFVAAASEHTDDVNVMFANAIAAYRADQADRRQSVIDELGLTPEQVAQFEAARRAAPPVLGSDAGGSGGTEARKERKGLDGLFDAIDEAVMNPKNNPPIV